MSNISGISVLHLIINTRPKTSRVIFYLRFQPAPLGSFGEFVEGKRRFFVVMYYYINKLKTYGGYY
ncbi:hypothetical protein D6X60_18920 [Escherichia albertii]|nr:hypothetical protein [Escherichia albertii]KAF0955325.1 hypothetical protein AQU20_10790 [Escherichia albertii]